MNVLLLVIDALRPDHLKCNGYSRATSPNMDKLSQDGALFRNSYTTLPRSHPAIASMLTGMYPHTHSVRLVWGNNIPQSMTTLTQILKSHGYVTAFIRSGGVPKDGTERGFDYYDPLSWKIKNKLKRGIFKVSNPGNFMGIAEQRFNDAIKWVKTNKKKKFFLSLHTNDLHWPYILPKPYEHMFDPDYKGPHTFSDLSGGKISRGDLIYGRAKMSDEEINHAIAHYDGGIRYIDHHFGRLMDTLKELNLYDDTLVILTSDHGEHFAEHGLYFQHGASVYEPALKNTLIIKVPGKDPKSGVVDSYVQSHDLMPTILDALNIPLVDEVEGFSLLPLVEGKIESVREFVFCEGAEEHFKQAKRMYFKGIKGKWRTMLKDGWKVILIPHPEKNIFELYNIEQDPKEKNNLIDVEKERAEEMKQKILEFMKNQVNEGDAKKEDLTEKSKKLLISAGYLEE